MRRFIKPALIVIIIVSCIVLAIYNFRCNDEFFKTSMATIISLLNVILISYYLVQSKNDSRKKHEKMDLLLDKIQKIILSEGFIHYGTSEINSNTLMMLRTVGNKIKLLEDLENTKENEKLIQILRENFKKLKEFYSDHMNDIEYMDKSKKEISNFIHIMDDYCDKLHMELI